MNKKINNIISVLVLAGLFITVSCKASGTKKEPESKQVSVTKGILNLLNEDNTKAAYLRMDASFQQLVSLERYESDWREFIADKGELKLFQLKAGPESQSYMDVFAVLNFAKAKLYAKYTFSKNSAFPVDVEYGKYTKKVISQAFREAEKTSTDKGLKDLCASYFKLGFGANGTTKKNAAINLDGFLDTGKKDFSSCTLTNMMKPVYVMDQWDSMDEYIDETSGPVMRWDNIDPMLQWAYDNGVQIRGHTLVWHTQTPTWFFCEKYDDAYGYVGREEMINRLDSFTRQYMTYVQEKYPGVVYCWDVVNEAVDPSGGDKDSFFRCRMENGGYDNLWYNTIGADYPEVAFKIARKYAAPGVSLIYNDYSTTDPVKREYIYKLCEDLKNKGLIDGIGMQAYWDLKNPSIKDIKETIEYYAKLGLEIQLTEWSISAPAATEAQFKQQAERYASIFRLLQKLDTQGGGNANITCVSFFGLMDHYPLYDKDDTTSRLFDKDLQPKPVYYSIKETMEKFYK